MNQKANTSIKMEEPGIRREKDTGQEEGGWGKEHLEYSGT